MELLFSVIQVIICVVLIFLVLMHSGKDAGLSGAFGVGTGQGPLGGGSLVERNLNRWTIGFAIAFAVNTILLLKNALELARRRRQASVAPVIAEAAAPAARGRPRRSRSAARRTRPR